MHLQFFRTKVLDKNEKCVNLIEFIQEADRCVKSVKERLLERSHETTYSCRMCNEVHDLKDALFSGQESTLWDGKTSTMRRKDGTEVQVMDSPSLFEPCGEDEFTVKVEPLAKKVSQ